MAFNWNDDAPTFWFYRMMTIRRCGGRKARDKPLLCRSVYKCEKKKRFRMKNRKLWKQRKPHGLVSHIDVSEWTARPWNFFRWINFSIPERWTTNKGARGLPLGPNFISNFFLQSALRRLSWRFIVFLYSIRGSTSLHHYYWRESRIELKREKKKEK